MYLHCKRIRTVRIVACQHTHPHAPTRTHTTLPRTYLLSPDHVGSQMACSYTSPQTHARTHTHARTRTYTHTHAHARTRTHTHAHTYLLSLDHAKSLIPCSCPSSCISNLPSNAPASRRYDESSECESARQHKMAGYRLERTLMGCADPPSTEGRCTPSVISSSPKTKWKWGSLSRTPDHNRLICRGRCKPFPIRAKFHCGCCFFVSC